MSDKEGTDGPAVDVEPAAPVAAPRTCANCAAALDGAFCAACGQPADTRVPTVPALFGEILDGFFNVDSRVWRTLIPLVSKPGFLTVEYFAGRRARYVAPFRLYLVVSLFSLIVGSIVGEVDSSAAGFQTVDTSDEGLPSDFNCDFRTEITEGAWFWQRIEATCERLATDGGWRLALQGFQNRLPLLLFVTLPVYAVVLELLYLFSDRRYAEHLFFLFHVHAFFYAAVTLWNVVGVSAVIWPTTSVIVNIIRFAVPLYFIYYVYLALRRVYDQSPLLTLAKLCFIGVSYFVVLGVVMAMGVLYSIFIF